jgi:hypothetical protein
MISNVEMENLATRQLHYYENAENTKPNRVLHEEVARPHGLGLVLQEGSPNLRICRPRTPLDHVFPDGRACVANAKFHFRLQGDAIFTVLGMIR